jgi:hypothetical protein
VGGQEERNREREEAESVGVQEVCINRVRQLQNDLCPTLGV